MAAEPSPPDRRETFEALVHHAVTRGHMSADARHFGPDTRAAVARIVAEHPEAEAELIADAYDAYVREHG